MHWSLFASWKTRLNCHFGLFLLQKFTGFYWGQFWPTNIKSLRHSSFKLESTCQNYMYNRLGDLQLFYFHIRIHVWTCRHYPKTRNRLYRYVAINRLKNKLMHYNTVNFFSIITTYEHAKWHYSRSPSIQISKGKYWSWRSPHKIQKVEIVWILVSLGAIIELSLIRCPSEEVQLKIQVLWQNLFFSKFNTFLS